jgi:AcrR family transcriptional regulator
MRSDAMANQERVLAAAVTAVLREGRQVPMATIAAQARVGIGTLYRRYPSREALLEALTLRSFLLILNCANDAENLDGPGLAAVSSFLDCVISHRDELVLPLHGGPLPSDPDTLAARTSVHQALGRLLDRGRVDGSIRADATTRDIIVLGAMLAQIPDNPDTSQASLRLKAIFLDGLTVSRVTPPAEEHTSVASATRNHRPLFAVVIVWRL